MLPLKGWATSEELAHAAQDMRAAVALVDERGWCRKVSELDTGPVCAARAIGIITGVHDWDTWGGRSVIVLAAVFRIHGQHLVTINDTSDSWTEVKAKMLAVADECEKASRLWEVSGV